MNLLDNKGIKDSLSLIQSQVKMVGIGILQQLGAKFVKDLTEDQFIDMVSKQVDSLFDFELIVKCLVDDIVKSGKMNGFTRMMLPIVGGLVGKIIEANDEVVAKTVTKMFINNCIKKWFGNDYFEQWKALVK